MDLNIKKVEVLMSTYNGEKYLCRQLDSILNQIDVDIHITIRDDGSNDGTINILKEYETKFPNKVKIFEGKNIGYKRSFLLLLSMATNADYYAFSDQDDIWIPEKLSSAIDLIYKKDVVLYVSNLFICDTQLKILRKTTFSKKYSSIYSDFTRHRYAGCTYVFDNKLKEILLFFSNLNLPPAEMPGYDDLIARCAYACGEVVLDESSYIQHIRYKESITAGGNGIVKRFKSEWKNINSPSVTSKTALLILNYISDYVKSENKDFLKQLAFYKDSFYGWFSLLFNNRMKTGILICDMMCKFKILIRRY